MSKKKQALSKSSTNTNIPGLFNVLLTLFLTLRGYHKMSKLRVCTLNCSNVAR